MIEKNIIQILNTKLREMFEYINDIISKGTEPDKLNIIMNKIEKEENAKKNSGKKEMNMITY